MGPVRDAKITMPSRPLRPRQDLALPALGVPVHEPHTRLGTRPDHHLIDVDVAGSSGDEGDDIGDVLGALWHQAVVDGVGA